MQYILERIQTAYSTLSLIEGHKWKIDWLLKFGFPFTRIANLGCNIGYETIALLWYLNAKEAIGFDINADRINQAQSTVEHLRDDLETINRGLLYSYEKDENIRELAKKIVELYEGKFFPSFITADITKGTGFLSDYFDLVYCERVLYHFACNNNKANQNNISLAIQEMYKMAKPGGIIVAIEPRICSPENDSPINLHGDFVKVGLVKIEVHGNLGLFENKEIYSYLKPKLINAT